MRHGPLHGLRFMATAWVLGTTLGAWPAEARANDMSSIGMADAFVLWVVAASLVGIIALSIVAAVLGRRRAPRSRVRLALSLVCVLVAAGATVGSVLVLAWALQWEVRLTALSGVVAAALGAAPLLLAVRAVRRQWPAVVP